MTTPVDQRFSDNTLLSGVGKSPMSTCRKGRFGVKVGFVLRYGWGYGKVGVKIGLGRVG